MGVLVSTALIKQICGRLFQNCVFVETYFIGLATVCIGELFWGTIISLENVPIAFRSRIFSVFWIPENFEIHSNGGIFRCLFFPVIF